MFDKYLPSRFTSWFALYQDIKQLIRPGHDTVAWVDASPIQYYPAKCIDTERHVYLVRHIYEETLDELIELRELQTFSKDELDVLRAALHHYSGFNPGEQTKAVRQKVQTLFIEQLKKERG